VSTDLEATIHYSGSLPIS